MGEQVDNRKCDEEYRAGLPKPNVLERKISMIRDYGVVAMYSSLEEHDITAILKEQPNEDLHNLRRIESAIGYTALDRLIEKHQDYLADAISYAEVESFSEEEQVIRRQLDQDFIQTHLVFTS